MNLVDLILTHQQITEEAVRGKICIVIDTLRATSTMVTALSQGCREIIPVASVQEALELKKRKHQNYLLGGEVEGHHQETFDLGNSPLEYRGSIIKNKGIIFTTTNGTRTLLKLESARKILICALLNAKTVGEWLVAQKNDLVLCCSGTRGNYSPEDFLTAGRLAADLQARNKDFFFSDLAVAAACFYKNAVKHKNNKKAVVKLLEQSDNGRRLLEAGQKQDIDFCSREDIFRLLPFYEKGSVKAAKIPGAPASISASLHI
ncbi:MAG TPA: 2-phosphosulfolactate phosphatase [Firmicutes bacterium]|jgi:2-phosphosulfolactate phosphatase|nr:2-phosphosulfolactate phosphatase [Bacillota bacterium]